MDTINNFPLRGNIMYQDTPLRSLSDLYQDTPLRSLSDLYPNRCDQCRVLCMTHPNALLNSFEVLQKTPIDKERSQGEVVNQDTPSGVNTRTPANTLFRSFIKVVLTSKVVLASLFKFISQKWDRLLNILCILDSIFNKE